MEPQLRFAQLVEKYTKKILHEHISTDTNLNTNSTSSHPINNLSLEIDNLIIDDIHAMEQDIAHGINVVRHKYSNDPNFKGKPLFLNFVKNAHAPDMVFLRGLRKSTQNHLIHKIFKKQTFNQAMRGNQNLPNRQVTSNNMTGKPLPSSYRSRSNSRDQRNHSRHRSPNKIAQNNSKPYYGSSNFKPPSRNGSPYPRPNSQKNSQHNSIPQSPHSNSDGNRSRRPFSRNRLQSVRNYINSLLDQEQTDNTTSNTENVDTSIVSEETLLEQHINHLLLELNQDTQDENLNCQEECNTLTEDNILSTSCKNNVWVLPLTIYTQQTLDHKKTISPPHLEIDFLLDFVATLDILNADAWNEIKEYHKLQLKASTFVLSAANNSKLKSKGTINLTL